MFGKKSLVAASIILATVAITGCKSAPVQNVVDAPVTTATQKYAQDDVRKAILNAGAKLGWQMKDVEPGYMIATLTLRTHLAQVDIHYNKQNYNIVYKNSTNLDYDGTSIHSNYNGWIQNLDNAIRANLSAL
ncbi:MAG: hypothetical protein FNT29_06590 [Halothiobacillaceae bacterium]|nr:MAG: hypothetical protein FNT29_06590 [Halothiobacillaceae bacterium]